LLTFDEIKKLSRRKRLNIDGATAYIRQLSGSGTMYFSEGSVLIRGENYLVKEYKDRADGVLMEVIKL
jgi:hypothetical protein